MIKLFSNRKFRRLGVLILLGVQIGCFSGQIVGYAATDPPSTPVPPVAIDTSAQDSANTAQSGTSNSGGLSSGDVQSAAQSGAQAALDDSVDDISQKVADQLSGGTGVTWGDIYASLNEVDSAVKGLDEYVKSKNITSTDYYATIVGMYLSQYTACCQGNLLNVVTGLEEDLEDSDLNTKLMIGNKKDAITLKKALDYIKSNYCVTPCYKGNEEKNIDSPATLRDLYEKDETALYIKDTELKVNSFEVTNTKDASATISKVDSGIEAWIPALSFNARNSDSFKINKLNVQEVDKSYCVFNASSACRLALQFSYSELERYNEYESNASMWQENETLLDQGLYIDNFGNIVALDASNKQYTIVLNCMLNPTICETGSSEKFNMEAYGVQQVYTGFQAASTKELGLNYDKSKQSFEYRVALSDTAKDLIDSSSDYVASKWVTNLLGNFNKNPSYKDYDYFAVFSFANNDEAKADSTTASGKDKVSKPKGIKVKNEYGSTELGNKQKTKGGEYTPATGFNVGCINGSEGSKGGLALRSKDKKGMSVAYIRTNHNRATEAYYGYKSWIGQRLENGFEGYKSWFGGKSTSASRGNMGEYTCMPIPTKCLFYGISNTTVKADSEVLKFDQDPLVDGEEKVKDDILGYYKDYTSFYSGSDGSKSTNKTDRYIGFLYTPKTIERGTQSYMPENKALQPSIRNIDADTILYHLRLSCKLGILRKANITNLGRKTSNGKKPKGMKGYQEATTKLIEEANSKVTDYIDPGFDLDDDSPISGIKYKDIWALGLDIYGNESDLLEQSKRSVVVYDNCVGKTHNQKDYDTVSLFMAITKNTSGETVKVSSTGELSAEAKQSLKEEKATDILDRVLDMLTNPITTFVKLVSGFLQWIHTGLTNGNLASFFYVTDDDVTNWLRKMPYILLLVTLMIFAIRIAICACKYVFTKNGSFKDLAKNFVQSAMLITVPLICLNLMRSGIATISDKGMNDSAIKIESVYLNKQLTSSAETQVADSQSETTAKYFIEHFQSKSTAKVSIQILDTSEKVKTKSVNPNKGKTSGFMYETYNIGSLPANLVNIANNNSQMSANDILTNKYGLTYDGKKFNTVLHSYYKKSVFFYFMDYYLNEWTLLNGKNSYYYEGDANWAATMENEMCTSKDSFRNLYNKRSVVYGPSAGLSSADQCLDDIFGLGQLFYHDGKTASSRGYYLPIEIYDSQMRVKDVTSNDKTSENSSNDIWNSYKHGSYFIDKRFTKEQDLSSEDTEDQDRLGKSDNNMAYGFEALKARKKKYPNTAFKAQVIASEAVFEANGIDKDEATELEQALWEVNASIYRDVIDYFEQSTGEVNDFTDAVMLACISTFRFNEQFGKSFSLNDSVSLDPESSYVFKVTDTTKPISFDKDKLDMDVIMKAVYAGDTEVQEDYDLMYYLGTDTFGAVAAIILIVAEIFMIGYIIIRMVHLVVVYALVTVVCTFQYSLKGNSRNKAWLGVLSQALYFLAAHLVQIFMLNMAVCNDLDRGSMTSILLSILILLGSGFGMAIEIKVLVFLITNFKDLGGQIIADKVESAMANIKGKIQGKLNGDMKSDRVKLDADEVKSYGNDDDNELKENGSGNTELAESVEQADKVRGEALLAGATPTKYFQSNQYMDIDIDQSDRSLNQQILVTGGKSFGTTNFETSGGSDVIGNDSIYSLGGGETNYIGGPTYNVETNSDVIDINGGNVVDVSSVVVNDDSLSS